ncbi:MAG: 50S ribosomal protein L13 [Candidatus Cloacimonadota bacterium]|nr:MAG: 50S ribosomal protein L13 [Candidatus Cloacimonadota bacterium]
MKTYIPRKNEIEKKWYLIDVSDQVLGRVASKIAMILMGKNKPTYTPNLDMGDYVVIINADKIKVTGNKSSDKIYHRYSGYQGGLKSIPYNKMMEKKPTDIISYAVKGMLPKNKLRSNMMKRLKVYVGNQHNNQAQKPIPIIL